MDMLSMFKTSVGSEGTNPITKSFKLGKQVGSAGPEMVWKVYSATKIETGQVSVLNSNVHKLSVLYKKI